LDLKANFNELASILILKFLQSNKPYGLLSFLFDFQWCSQELVKVEGGNVDAEGLLGNFCNFSRLI